MRRYIKLIHTLKSSWVKNSHLQFCILTSYNNRMWASHVWVVQHLQPTSCHFVVSGNDSALVVSPGSWAEAAITSPLQLCTVFDKFNVLLHSSWTDMTGAWTSALLAEIIWVAGSGLRGPVLHSFGTVNLFHWSAFRADSGPAPQQSARNTHCRGDKGASLIGTESPLSNQGNTESN